MTELWLCSCGAEIHRRPCHVNQYHRLKMGCRDCKIALTKGVLTFPDFTISMQLWLTVIAETWVKADGFV